MDPGTYSLQYGGPLSIGIKEGKDYLEDEWRDWVQLQFNEGAISWIEWRRQQENITALLNEWQSGPPWWHRKWYNSLEEKNGGAPEQKILIRIGRTFNIITTNFFTLSNTGDFKLRSVSASYDFNRGAALGLDDIDKPVSGWKFNFSPDISFSSSQLLSNPLRVVRKLGLEISAIHTIRRIDIVRIRTEISFFPIRHDLRWFFQLEILNW